MAMQIKVEAAGPDGPGTLIPFCKRINSKTPENQAVVQPGAATGTPEKTTLPTYTGPSAPAAPDPSFYYRAKFMPDHVLHEWERICNLPGRGFNKNALKRAFRDEADKLQGNTWDSEYFNKFRKIQEETKQGAVWSWMNWTQVKEKDGEALGLELVNTGFYDKREHKGIDPKTTTLKWPDTHEFKVFCEKGSSFKQKIEGMASDTGPVEGDAKAFDEMFDSACPQPLNLTKSRKPQPKEKTAHEKTVSSLKQSHRTWDETVRTSKALLLKAGANRFVSKDLIRQVEVKMTTGSKVDAKIQQQEVIATNGKVFNETEIQGINTILNEMEALKESMKKYSDKIKSILELG